jgi:hypothetical protein
VEPADWGKDSAAATGLIGNRPRKGRARVGRGLIVRSFVKGADPYKGPAPLTGYVPLRITGTAITKIIAPMALSS